MKKVKLAIIEDDKNWTSMMVEFLSRFKNIEVIGTATNSKEGIELIKKLDIDVLLLDINLQGNMKDGIYTAVEILDIKKIKIIMLTSLTDQNIIIDAFNAGASNYIIKSNYENIPNVIFKTMEEELPLSVLLEEFKRLKYEEQVKDLTSTEKEIIKCIDKGYTQLQMEKILYKTQNTIKTQVKSILRKLNVKTSKDAVKKIKNRGL